MINRTEVSVSPRGVQVVIKTGGAAVLTMKRRPGDPCWGEYVTLAEPYRPTAAAGMTLTALDAHPGEIQLT